MAVSDKRKPGRKVNVYVYRTLPDKCPSCKMPIKRAEYVGKNNKVMKADLAICKKCKKNYVSAWFYNKYKYRLNSLNPEETDIFVKEILANNQRKNALKNALYEKVITKKLEAFEKVRPALNPKYGFDLEAFKKAWMQSSVDADTLIAAVIIKEQKKKTKYVYECVFISESSNINKLSKSDDSGFCIVNTHNLIANRALASIKTGHVYFMVKEKKYSVCRLIVLDEGKLKELLGKTVSYDDYYRLRPKKELNKIELIENGTSAPRQRECDKDENRYVHVYFSLTNSCIKNKHEIEAVTAKTTNIKNGNPVEVNVFYCSQCDKYFINFEALQKYISRGIYPALHYIFDSLNADQLNDASELMLYGYNVREGGLSQFERRRILEWVIDSGLMSKAAIISNLQFKVRYNGRKPGNERAKQKWLDDILFVSQYVYGNKREIKAVFVFKKDT